MGHWESAVLASLLLSKQAGFTFERARRLALRSHPPSSDLTDRPLACSGRECLAKQDEAKMFCAECGSIVTYEPSRADTFLGFCEDAWHDRRRALQHFNTGLLMAVDETQYAQTVRDYNPINVRVAA